MPFTGLCWDPDAEAHVWPKHVLAEPALISDVEQAGLAPVLSAPLQWIYGCHGLLVLRSSGF